MFFRVEIFEMGGFSQYFFNSLILDNCIKIIDDKDAKKGFHLICDVLDTRIRTRKVILSTGKKGFAN